MWFVFALISVLAWGGADLFYKLGADSSERYTHLKTTIAVGFVMGLHALITLLSVDVDYKAVNLLLYLPVSLCYIVSMAVGYFGLRYLTLSVSSPVQNASGAVTCILCIVVLKQYPDVITAIAVAFICIGVFLLGLFEGAADKSQGSGKLRGLGAFMLPIIYCLIDAAGTFLDAYYLDDPFSTPLVGASADTLETVANLSYEFTFFIVAALLFVYVYLIKREKLITVVRPARLAAAGLETAGQLTYVYAMSGLAVAAAPMIASYSMVSVLLSRIFLKERLQKRQYLAIGLILLGIIAMGILEGLDA